MREIRFNAWNRVNKTMHCFINHPDNWSFSYLDQDVFIWLQYTGLNDKNGKDIYEGDIIENDNGARYIVVWIEQIAGFYLTLPHSCRGKGFISCAASKSIDSPMLLFKDAVVGNKFQNPEFLNP